MNDDLISMCYVEYQNISIVSRNNQKFKTLSILFSEHLFRSSLLKM